MRSLRGVVTGLPEWDRCAVMGVVNVTPDSFSDGGRWFDTGDAVKRGLELVAEGADLVDVGGESTRPGPPGWTRRRSCAGSSPWCADWPPRA